MKHKLTLLVLLSFACVSFINAQVPQAIPYQAVARDNAGNLLANQTISLRTSIRDVSAGGSILYRETHSTTTNNLGLFTINVGTGTPVIGTFASINWSASAKFLQVEMDAAGGSSFLDMGTQQLLSVPYAFNSATSTDNRWSVLANNIFKNNSGNVGIGTNTPLSLLHVNGNGGVNTPLARLQSPVDSTLTLSFTTPFHSWMVGHNRPPDHVNATDGFFIFDKTINLTRFWIGTSGYVGIGTIAPNSQLHVNGLGGLLAPLGRFQAMGDSSATILFTTNFKTWTIGQNRPPDQQNAVDGFFIHDRDNNKTRLYIDTDGDVGVNTNNPTAKLDVNGTVRIGTNGSALNTIMKVSVSAFSQVIPANSTAAQTFGITNTLVGATVSVSTLNALPTGLAIANCRVSTAGTIEVTIANVTNANITLPSGNIFYFAVIQ